MDRALLILNPVAGRGRALKALPRVEKALAEMGLPHETVRTRGPGDATDLARQGVKAGIPQVLCIGGDGTVSEVARGVMGSSSVLVVLPAGTGNDFARILGFHCNLARALRALQHGHLKTIDMGRFGPHIFINTVGIGYAGLVTLENARVKHLKGLASYLAAVLRTLPGYQPPLFHLKARDWEYRGRGIMLELGNGRCSGGGFFLTPGADLQDGLLDVTLLGDYPPLQRFAALPMVMARRMHWLKEVRFFRADLLEVAVDRPTYIHVDGNLASLSGSAAAEIIPRAIRVLFDPEAPEPSPRRA